MNWGLARWSRLAWWNLFVCYFLSLDAHFIRPNAHLWLWVAQAWDHRLWQGGLWVVWPIGRCLGLRTFLKGFGAVSKGAVITLPRWRNDFWLRLVWCVMFFARLIKKLLGWFLAIIQAKRGVLFAEEINWWSLLPTLVKECGPRIAWGHLLGVWWFLVDRSLDLNHGVRGLLIAHVVWNLIASI